MQTTWLMADLEAEMGGESISVYLHRKMAAGWTLSAIQDDLVTRTGISVSLTTLSVWTRRMSYSRRQAADMAWQHRLIPQADMRSREKTVRLASIHAIHRSG